MKKTKYSKSKIKTLIIIILIILMVFVIYLLKLKSYSKDKVFQKLILGLDNLNYTYFINNGNNKIQVFGKYEKKIYDEDEIEYFDYGQKDTYYTYNSSKFMMEYYNKGIEDMDYYQKFIKYYFENDDYSYYYKGKKDFNGQKCIIIDFRNIVEPLAGSEGILMWINDSLNIVEKIEYYYYNDGKENVYDTTVYSFHTNENKLEDVKAPDYIFSYQKPNKEK